MLCIFLADMLHAKIVNTKGEGDGAGVVLP
jgi:hypothetical protein